MAGLTPLISSPQQSVTSGLDPRDLGQNVKTDDPGAVQAVAKEFESLFLHQLFKSMRQTIGSSEDSMMNSGMGGEMFTDMLDAEYAKSSASQGGIGLADMVTQQLSGATPTSGTGQHEPRRPQGVSGSAARELGAMRARSAYAGVDASATMSMPVAGGRVSSNYGMRKLDDDAAARMHKGLDIAAPEGAPIRAALPGTVVHSGWIKGYGKSVIVDHGNGTTTLYGHASELLVDVGQTVSRGAPIARVGSTGHSTGPHLHFEVRHHGESVDPARPLGLR